MTRLPHNGDRIRLLSMTDDPDPIPAGATGTVRGVTSHGALENAWHQIDVRWDNGRTLLLVVPPDVFEIIAASD